MVERYQDISVNKWWIGGDDIALKYEAFANDV